MLKMDIYQYLDGKKIQINYVLDYLKEVNNYGIRRVNLYRY